MLFDHSCFGMICAQTRYALVARENRHPLPHRALMGAAPNQAIHAAVECGRHRQISTHGGRVLIGAKSLSEIAERLRAMRGVFWPYFYGFKFSRTANIDW
jgi:hypothetical protein